MSCSKTFQMFPRAQDQTHLLLFFVGGGPRLETTPLYDHGWIGPPLVI